ncbi:MAG: penicillin-binding protein 2, partial [Candidatus Veblenbacteria bacterium]|nr:penicillin-binding protein 2 [Candidatus Veblenbacteria bacterium]
MVTLILRLFQLQVLDHGFYSTLASGQHDLFAQLLPERGEVYIQDPLSGGLYPVAVNRTLALVYAVPKDVTDSARAAELLAPLLELDEADLAARLAKTEDPYEPLKHAVDDELKVRLIELELAGIHLAPETVRYYPAGENFGQVVGFIGFVGVTRQGQYGVEQYWESTLAGAQGELKTEREAGGGVMALGQRELTPAVDGADLVLTLDKNVQLRACAAIRKAVESHGALSGSIVIMEPATGAIRGLCGAPNFDSNSYATVESPEVFANVSVSATYEPGSVFKPITMAAALAAGKVTPATTYTDTGEVRIGPDTIRNSDLKAHGVQTMTQVLQESLNTGAIFALRQAGVETFRDTVERFGFGQLTGVELPGESTGSLGALREKNEIYAATASFGQGITVSPLQLTTAFGAIANKGRLMKPYLVSEVRYA